MNYGVVDFYKTCSLKVSQFVKFSSERQDRFMLKKGLFTIPWTIVHEKLVFSFKSKIAWHNNGEFHNMS